MMKKSNSFLDHLERDSLYIIHKGEPPTRHSRLGDVEPSMKWPDNLWGKGNLVYNVENHLDFSTLERPKGKLVFSSMFESGNLWKAYEIGENQYHLLIEHDPDLIGRILN